MNNQETDKIKELENKLSQISKSISPKKEVFLRMFEILEEAEARVPATKAQVSTAFSKTENILKNIQDFVTRINPTWRYVTLSAVLLVVVVPMTINYFTNTKRYISQGSDSLIASNLSLDEVTADDKTVLQDLDLTQVYDIQK